MWKGFVLPSWRCVRATECKLRLQTLLRVVSIRGLAVIQSAAATLTRWNQVATIVADTRLNLELELGEVCSPTPFHVVEVEEEGGDSWPTRQVNLSHGVVSAVWQGVRGVGHFACGLQHTTASEYIDMLAAGGTHARTCSSTKSLWVW